tara:strand:+ start:1233 stop:1355 length:123 start_codon:yes stop_codon:yes gene_type:complete
LLLLGQFNPLAAQADNDGLSLPKLAARSTLQKLLSQLVAS